MASAYCRTLNRLAFLSTLRPFMSAWAAWPFVHEIIMALETARGEIIGRLEGELRLASLVPAVFSKIIEDACRRIPNLSRSRGVARLDRLIAASAWTDAAFALVELELPAWSIKRLSAKMANGSARYRGSRTCPWHSTIPRTRVTIACRSPSCSRFCKRGAWRKSRRQPCRRRRICGRRRTA
jgi:hypothetical protein